ncbi:MAG: tRNA lysidine(34) synthetase TilS [Planctomycetia bacterium]|nr:tRNA lysidine(34) synthetase TilS [Planctomycetia bacterium]
MSSHLPRTTETFPAHLAAGLETVGFLSGPALIAVSGGADSVALLVGLCAVAATRSDVPPFTVAHVEHDLRPTAPRDATFVAALAERLRLPYHCARVAVRTSSRRGEGLEGLARRLRYGSLHDMARASGAVSVVVAHTADDQAETILHRIARGTGLAGLAGMPARRSLGPGIDLLRPLLAVPGAATRAFLRERGESWCEDESNTDRRFARNFLRHEVLPRFADGPYPAVREALVRLGAQAAEAAAALEGVARGLLAAHARRTADGGLTLDAAALAEHQPHVIAEVFASLWRREGWPRRDMTRDHYRRLAGMLVACAGGRPPGDVAFPAGLRVTATGHEGRWWLHIRRADGN